MTGMAYTFHYSRPHVGGLEQSCAELVYRLSTRVPRPSEPGPLSELELAREWEEIAKLRWRFQSEGAVDVAEIRSRLGGGLERAKFAITQIAHNKGQMLRGKVSSEEALHQIIAFGCETFTVAAADAEYLQFAEKELQAVSIKDL